MNALAPAPAPVTETPPARRLPAPLVPRVDDTCLETLMQASVWPALPKTLGFQLGQSWLPNREAAFRPGAVWLAATDNALLVCADLTDDCVRTFARADNQPIWDLGDAFEFFLQPAGCASYFEFQIAPNGCLLQLRYPRDGDPRKYGIESYIVHTRRLIDFQVAPRRNGWRVALRLPVAPLLAFSLEPLGENWRLAFCRYDYDIAGRFTLSSSAPLTRPDFHRQQEWSPVHVPGGFPPAPRASA